MESDRLSEHAQSLVSGVKRENPWGRGNPTINNNIGKFNLPDIWDRVLLNTPGLNLKRQVNNNNPQLN